MSRRTPTTTPPPSLDELVEKLSLDPEREPIASELGVLQSIYDQEAITLIEASDTIRYEISVSVPTDYDTDAASDPPSITICVSLPRGYPATAPPQLQLLSRYLGPYSVDPPLFGAVLRTYISRGCVEWVRGAVCVFDGIEAVREACGQWLTMRRDEQAAVELQRQEERGEHRAPDVYVEEGEEPADELAAARRVQPAIPAGVQLVQTAPIVDRKSVFIGHACRITDPAQVEGVLEYLLADRRIGRASHPIIHAWRCRVGPVMYQDYDDNREPAAGSRLGHLLQIMEVDNVLVVVTRFYGGIHIGPDRFKHINQAARNALAMGGLLDDAHEGKKGRKKR